VSRKNTKNNGWQRKYYKAEETEKEERLKKEAMKEANKRADRRERKKY
jgi:hypothetical protein